VQPKFNQENYQVQHMRVQENLSSNPVATLNTTVAILTAKKLNFSSCATVNISVTIRQISVRTNVQVERIQLQPMCNLKILT
jgi:hypothetical protein